MRDALNALILRAALRAERPQLAGGYRQLGIHIRMAANLSEDVPNVGSESTARPWNDLRAMAYIPTHVLAARGSRCCAGSLLTDGDWRKGRWQ